MLALHLRGYSHYYASIQTIKINAYSFRLYFENKSTIEVFQTKVNQVEQLKEKEEMKDLAIVMIILMHVFLLS